MTSEYSSEAGAADKNPLAAYQHEQLCRAAEASGRLGDLLYYYAALRDEAALAALETRATAGHPEDQLVWSLLQPAGPPLEPARLLDLAAEARDPWTIYTLVKYLLRRSKISEAVAIAARKLGEGVCDVLLLNLIARYARHAGHPEVAMKLASRSLELAPEQRDVARLVELLNAGQPAEARPCLDLLPPQHRVAYYLPCYNVEDHIARTIEAVSAMCYPLEEILIIDDASPDRSIEIARQYPVRIVSHEENRGLAAARNTAWQNTDAEFIGTVDTDASPASGYVKCALMEFEQAGPALALAGGRLIEAYTDTPADAFRAAFMGQDPGLCRAYMDELTPTAETSGSGSFMAHTGQSFVTGSDTLARRAALEAAGGYPERFRTNAEDAAICQLLRQSGRHIVFTPNCIATHYRRDTVASVLRTSWNYGYWFRHDSGFYVNAVSLMSLLDDYTVASHHFTMRSLEEKHSHLLYIEFLFPFYSMMLDACHGVTLGHISARQALTIRHDLEQVIADLDARFGGALLEKARADLPPWTLGAEITPEPLDPDARQVLDQGLVQMRADQKAYNAAFYQLLLDPS